MVKGGFIFETFWQTFKLYQEVLKCRFLLFGLDWKAGSNLQRSQQTQNICITFIQRRPDVFDVEPTLYKCYTNVLCLLGFKDVF